MPRRNVAKNKVSWSDTMINDLLWCKKEAIRVTKGENPPRKENGRKMGYMEYLYNLWNEKGYGYLNLSRQNLSDEAAQAERRISSFTDSIAKTIAEDRTPLESQENDNNILSNNIELSDQDNEVIISNGDVNELSEKSLEIFSIYHQ